MDSNNDGLIPCELCSELIPFENYDAHVRFGCIRRQNQVRLLNFFDNEFGMISLNIPYLVLNNLNNSNINFVSFEAEEEVDMDENEFNTVLSEIVGNVEVGIENINDVCTKVEDVNEIKDEICPICYDSFSSIKCDKHQTLCNHVFCEQCIWTWLSKHKKCPICNTNLEDMKNLK